MRHHDAGRVGSYGRWHARVLREVAKVVAAGRPLFVATTHFHPGHTAGLMAFPAVEL